MPRLAARPGIDQRGIATAEGDQLVVVAQFDQTGVVDHRDPIGAAHRGKTVGHDDHGATLHQPLEGLLDHRLGAGIEVAGGLVEHEDGWVDERGAGQGDELALPGRQA